jgi:hypothetical protein
MNRLGVLCCVVALAATSGSCGFAKRHPGITTGIAAGSIAFATCSLSLEVGTCAAISGGIGVALGGTMGLLFMFTDSNAHEIPPDGPEDPVFVRHKEPPPDAGVPMIPADATTADSAAAP